MKYLIVFVLLFSALAHSSDLLTWEEFKQLKPQQRQKALKVYKDFIRESQKHGTQLESLTLRSSWPEFMVKAFAMDDFDCFYAGWPSKKKTVGERIFCTSPAKSNPNYTKAASTCGAEQLLCQPVLFGKGLCIEVKTQAQKNSAFSQCEKKFAASKVSLDALAKEALNTDISQLADEVFSLAYKLCEGKNYQASTSMCQNLKKKVARVKQDDLQQKAPEVKVVDKGQLSHDPELNEKLLQTVDKVNTAPDVAVEVNRKIACDACEQAKETQLLDEVLAPHEASELIDQSKTTPKDYCSGNQAGTKRQRYSNGLYTDLDNGVSVNILYQQEDEDKSKRVPSGFDIYTEKMGVGKPYVEEGVEYPAEEMEAMFPKRSFNYEYEWRGKESTLAIVDSPVREEYEGSGAKRKLKDRFISTDMRITNYSFFPRKNVPSLKKREGKIIMKLTTGEEIIIDDKTGRIISGVAKEVPAKKPLEKRPTNDRTYPDTDFSYTGEGLFIESIITDNLDQMRPGNLVPVKALVDGKLQECKLKSEDLWVRDYGYYLPQGHERFLSSGWQCTRYKIEKDEELYDMIKKKCPTFKFPPLAK